MDDPVSRHDQTKGAVDDQAEGTPFRREPRRRRIVVADDHAMLHDMLRSLLEPEFDIVRCVTDGQALVTAALVLRPDIALIDIGMPVLGGIDAGRQIHERCPAIKLVYLTMDRALDLAVEAFAAGASAYLLKTCPADELLDAMRRVAHGETYLTQAVAGGSFAALRKHVADEPTELLSQREQEVLRLVVRGLSMKEIARNLGISPRTVAFHKYRGMATLGLRRNADLVRFAIEKGMLRDPA